MLLALAAVVGFAPADVSALTSQHPGAERYLLKLINCTRTGGWVRANGTCSGYGSGRYSVYRRPLAFHHGISRDVTRPYARLMARRQVMSHTLGGTTLPERLRRAGYRFAACGENIGWTSKRPRAAVLAIHRIMQAEKSYNGPHWRNIKARVFRSVGIGVWRRNGKTWIATDFYTP
jgi:hypothetical protein